MDFGGQGEVAHHLAYPGREDALASGKLALGGDCSGVQEALPRDGLLEELLHAGSSGLLLRQDSGSPFHLKAWGRSSWTLDVKPGWRGVSLDIGKPSEGDGKGLFRLATATLMLSHLCLVSSLNASTCFLWFSIKVRGRRERSVIICWWKAWVMERICS